MISIFQPIERSHITKKSKRSWLNVILIKIEWWFLIDNIIGINQPYECEYITTKLLRYMLYYN